LGTLPGSVLVVLRPKECDEAVATYKTARGGDGQVDQEGEALRLGEHRQYRTPVGAFEFGASECREPDGWHVTLPWSDRIPPRCAAGHRSRAIVGVARHSGNQGGPPRPHLSRASSPPLGADRMAARGHRKEAKGALSTSKRSPDRPSTDQRVLTDGDPRQTRRARSDPLHPLPPRQIERDRGRQDARTRALGLEDHAPVRRRVSFRNSEDLR